LKLSLVSLKKEILEAGKRAYARGYVASNDGNISARIDKKNILITPTGISKGFMKENDLIVVDMNGKVVSGKKKPSSEIQMHLQIYKERADVDSVCHLHPPYATGFAVAGIPLDQYVLQEVIITLGTIPLVPYGTTGTDELYKALLPLLQNYDAFLLANHGALTVGIDIFTAYNKMETLEHAAQIIFIAKQLGNVNTLNAEQVEKLNAPREKFGIKANIGFPPGKKKV
jgi:L-fuculose-phosphate aldolase